MKINEPQRINNINPYRKQAENQAANNVERSKKKDQVEISPEAKELLETQNVEGNKARIEELKQSVAAGTYKVDARKLAERMLPFIK